MGTWKSEPIQQGDAMYMVIAHATGVHVVSECGDETISLLLTPEKARQQAVGHSALSEALMNAAARCEALTTGAAQSLAMRS